VEKSANSWEPGQESQWRGPPDSPGEFDDGIGSAENLARARENSHLLESLLSRKIQPAQNPFALERLEPKAASRTNALKTPGQFAAGTAIAVVKNPAARGNRVPGFCCFCQFRNHWVNFFKPSTEFRGV
jgi:hypothetical protein